MFNWVLNTSLLRVKNKKTDYLTCKLKTLLLLFMDGVQLSQGYRATARRQFTFYHSVSRNDHKLKSYGLLGAFSILVFSSPGETDFDQKAHTLLKYVRL